MRYEEIAKSIQNCANQYEDRYGIKTDSVYQLIRADSWAVFIANKSDGSQTAFYVRRNKRGDDTSWGWLCPSEDEANIGFAVFSKVYERINEKNNRLRVKP